MGFQDKKYDIRVVRSSGVLDGHNTDGDVTSGCLVRVLGASTSSESTIYSDDVRTAKTNIISRTQFATDERILFWSASESHDIFVADSLGNCGKFTVTPNTRTVVLSSGSPHKMLVAEFDADAADATEVDAGVDFPYGALVTDCFLYVITLDATETLDVGLLSTETAGDANGFLVTTSIASAGYSSPKALTTGSNEVYLGANEYGVLLGSAGVGTDAANDVGEIVLPGHLVDGSNAVSLSYTASSGSDTGLGLIYCPFTQLF